MNSAWFLNHTLIYPHLRARGSLIWMTLTRSLSWRLHTSFWWDASLWYGELVTFVILQSLVTLHVTKSLFLKGQRRRSDCAFGDPSVQTYTVMARGHTTNVSRQMNECVYRDNSMHFDQPQWHSNTGSNQSAHPEVWLHVLTAHVSNTNSWNVLLDVFPVPQSNTRTSLRMGRPLWKVTAYNPSVVAVGAKGST